MEQIEGQKDEESDLILFNKILLLFTGITLYSTVIICITKHISIEIVDSSLIPYLIPVLSAIFVILLIHLYLN